jgi:sulfotransferase
VAPLPVDTEHMTVGARESDSHYRMKYLHAQSARLVKPPRHEVPPRIQAQIDSSCAWYRQLYYPDPA